MSAENTAGTVLVADDDEKIVEMLREILEAEEYNVLSCSDGKAAIKMTTDRKPDVVLLDLNMPNVNGLQALKKLKSSAETSYTPVIMITGLNDAQARKRAIQEGADDFITKPPQIEELVARVRSLVKVKAYHDTVHNRKKQLEEEVREQTREIKDAMVKVQEAHEQLKAASFETVYRLARAAEFKDEDTVVHIRRIGLYAAAIAKELGESREFVDQIKSAAAMHDVGKIGIPDKILLKEGMLSQPERLVMQRHTTFGASILSGSEYSMIKLGEEIARSHHEWWDGSGYPDSLSGDRIPKSARIVAVADVFDALTTNRPYKDPYPVAKAISIIKKEREEHFEPRVVDAFIEILPEIRRIREDYPDKGYSIAYQLNRAFKS